MGTTLSSLKPPTGAKQKRKRVGRGVGSGLGTTAGRGDKGQGSRSGPDLGRGFEGGQMPLQRRLPKRGFKNPFRVIFTPVNVGQLTERFEVGSTVDPEELKIRGLTPRKSKLVKILGEGEITYSLIVKAHAFSKSAEEKIKAAGGSIEILSLRPTASATVPTNGSK